MKATGLGRRLLATVLLPLILVAAWFFGSRDSTSFFFPPLARILQTFATVWLSDRIGQDVVPSLLRLFVGYGVAALLGIGLGVVIGLFRTVRLLLEPVLELLRAVPPTVLVPVFMLFAGIGDVMKTLVIASGCVWPVLLNTVEGVRSRDEVQQDVAAVYHLGWASRLRRVILPGAAPQIFVGLRQALAIGVILMVISEMFAASNGIGFSIVQFQRGFAIPEMWSGIILLGLLGFALAQLMRLIEGRALAWYRGFRRAQTGVGR